jgi:hypothetical protein
MALTNFTPAHFLSGADTGSGTTVAISADTTLILTNMGPSPVAFNLGTSSTPTQPAALASTGQVVMPGHQSVPTAIGANGFLNFTGLSGTAIINVMTGA